MRLIAERIERATRQSFLTYDEYMETLESVDDRKKINNRMHELQEIGHTYWDARKEAIIEWLELLLIDNCVECG